MVVTFVLALGLVACGDEATDGEVLPETPLEEELGLEHVHGLGRNPGDDLLYVATHFGLWKVDEEEASAERVGNHHLDLMGFTVVGADHFVASGHPPLTDDIPPHLGLIETTDAGQTWVSRSLLGEADFHALTVADGQLWGFDASNKRLLRSASGQEWEDLGEHELLDFAVDPDQGRRVVAAAGTFEPQQLLLSSDGGETFEQADGPQLARLAWGTHQGLVGADSAGAVWATGDAGQQWEQVGELPGPPEALGIDDDELLAAADGALWHSLDGGRRWEELLRYTAPRE